jgi:CDGSH-type Zn-finger protein
MPVPGGRSPVPGHLDIEFTSVGSRPNDEALFAKIFRDHAAEIRFVIDDDQASRICHCGSSLLER